MESVLFGEVAGQLTPGTTVVDISTVPPPFASNAADRLATLGVCRVEACVIGNPAMAKSGQLRVFAAGDESDVDSVRDVLSALSQEIRYLGQTGSAGTLKIAFNVLLGIQTVLMQKDMKLAQAEAAAHGVRPPLVEASADRFAEVISAGRGDEDAAVVAELVARAEPPSSIESAA